jgi:hypothetical protein
MMWSNAAGAKPAVEVGSRLLVFLLTLSENVLTV